MDYFGVRFLSVGEISCLFWRVIELEIPNRVRNPGASTEDNCKPVHIGAIFLRTKYTKSLHVCFLCVTNCTHKHIGLQLFYPRCLVSVACMLTVTLQWTSRYGGWGSVGSRSFWTSRLLSPLSHWEGRASSLWRRGRTTWGYRPCGLAVYWSVPGSQTRGGAEPSAANTFIKFPLRWLCSPFIPSMKETLCGIGAQRATHRHRLVQLTSAQVVKNKK